MKVILCDKIEKLGKEGDIVKVKKGFARNYLFPRGLALQATPTNIRQWEHRMRLAAAKQEKAHREAVTLSEELEKLSLTIQVKVGEDDRMFGAVTASDIEKALQREGISIDRKNILLDEPIRELGVYTVSIRLYPEVEGKIKVWVVKE